MYKASTYGELHPNLLFEDFVSISTDTTVFNPKAKYKILLQLEPPEVRNTTINIIRDSKNFDLILAWNEDIINNCPNAKKFLFGSCWIDHNNFKPNKKNEISFLMSNKSFAPGHRFRHSVWDFLKGYNNNIFTIKKIKTPPRIESKNIIFENAKFSIIIENVKRVNWITEKLIDCFATKTVPIYYGCPNVNEWFDMDGIIKFNTVEELNNILNNLLPEDYDKKMNSIERNLKKSIPYYDYFQRVSNEIKILIDGKNNK